MLDTTWSVFQNYVRSFSSLIIKNVGLPIGFSFCVHEYAEIYNGFFDTFRNIFRFVIPELILTAETDQSVALK